MRAFISLLLIAALTTCALCDDNCDENLTCPPDAPEVCVFYSDLYCFAKYKNACAWNDIKCKYNLKFQLYALEFCELENFACPHPKHEQRI